MLAKPVIEKKFGLRFMPDRVANLTVPHNGRPACHYCDQCQRGCHTASYFNSPSVTLPAAAQTGKFTLMSDAVVSHVITNKEGVAEGVHFIRRETKTHGEVRARIIVLAAATLESTRILLNSQSPRFPKGMGNSNGVLGHYLMDHFTVEGAGGELPSLMSAKREATGNPCGYLIPKYANTDGHKNSNFLRGYRFDGAASQKLYEQAFSTPGLRTSVAGEGSQRDPIFDLDGSARRVPAALRQLCRAGSGGEGRLGHSCFANTRQLWRERTQHGQVDAAGHLEYAGCAAGEGRRSAKRTAERVREEHSRMRNCADGNGP